MGDYTLRLIQCGPNSPKNRVRRRDGLWHVWFCGQWIAATSSWDRAMRWATEGRLRWPE